MAAPTVAYNTNGGSSTTATVTAPTRASGDLLVFVLETPTGGTATTPTGWTLRANSSSYVRVYTKIAVNTTADNFSSTLGTNQQWGAQFYKFNHADGWDLTSLISGTGSTPTTNVPFGTFNASGLPTRNAQIIVGGTTDTGGKLISGTLWESGLDDVENASVETYDANPGSNGPVQYDWHWGGYWTFFTDPLTDASFQVGSARSSSTNTAYGAGIIVPTAEVAAKSGSASVSGTSSATSAGKKAVSGTASVSGTSSTSATGVDRQGWLRVTAVELEGGYEATAGISGSASVSGASSVSASGKRAGSGSGSVSHGHSTQAVGGVGAAGSGSASGSASATAAGLKAALSGPLPLSVSSGVAGAGSKGGEGTAATSNGHTATATGDALENHTGTATVNHTQSASAAGTALEFHTGTATVAHTQAGTAAGNKATAGTASVNHTQAAAATGTPLEHITGTAAANHTHSATAAGAPGLAGAATATNTSAATATGGGQRSGAATATHTQTATAAGNKSEQDNKTGTASTSLTSSATAIGTKSAEGAATAAGAGSASAAGSMGASGAATATAGHTALAVGAEGGIGSCSVSHGHSTVAAGTKSVSGAGSATGSSSAAAAGSFGASGTASVTATSGASAAGNKFEQDNKTGTASVSATAGQTAAGSKAATGTASTSDVSDVTAAGSSGRAGTGTAAHSSSAISSGSMGAQGAATVSATSGTSAAGTKALSVYLAVTAVELEGQYIPGDLSGSASAGVGHSVTAIGAKSVPGTGTVSGTSDTTAAGSRQAAGAPSVSATVTATASGVAEQEGSGSATVSAASSASAAGTKGALDIVAAFAGNLGIDIVGVSGRSSTASVTAASGTSATGSAATSGLRVTAVEVEGVYVPTGPDAYSGAATVNHGHTVTGSGVAEAPNTASVSHGHTVTASGSKGGQGDATVTAGHAVQVGPQPSVRFRLRKASGGSTLRGDDYLRGGQPVITEGVANVSHSASAVAAGTKAVSGTATVAQTHSVFVAVPGKRFRLRKSAGGSTLRGGDYLKGGIPAFQIGEAVVSHGHTVEATGVRAGGSYLAVTAVELVGASDVFRGAAVQAYQTTAATGRKGAAGAVTVTHEAGTSVGPSNNRNGIATVSASVGVVAYGTTGDVPRLFGTASTSVLAGVSARGKAKYRGSHKPKRPYDYRSFLQYRNRR